MRPPAMGLTTARVSRGSAVGDFDNDGGVDVVINNIDGAPTVAGNVGGGSAGHWLTVRLVGDPDRKCPRDAIGSVVFVTAGGVRRRGEVASGRGQISQSDLRVHIGLGRQTTVSKLEVRWANGDTVSYPIERVDVEVGGFGVDAPAYLGTRDVRCSSHIASLSACVKRGSGGGGNCAFNSSLRREYLAKAAVFGTISSKSMSGSCGA